MIVRVCYLAGEFIENLCKHQPELGITECDILCVKIAALCHDMGHGPYSHLYQDLFIPSYGKKWKVSTYCQTAEIHYSMQVKYTLGPVILTLFGIFGVSYCCS